MDDTPIEVVDMPPMDHREALAHELGATARLLPHLTREGLQEVRAWLRHPDTAATAVGSPLALVRADVLGRVCERLAEGSVDPEGSRRYYVGVGDLVGAVPDDASGLEDAP